MATGVELAVGYVTLTTETKSLARDVGRAFSGVETQAGRAGQAMGTAMTRSFNTSRPDMDGLRRQVEVAQQRITASAEQAAQKQEAASRKVAIAQAKLTEVTQKHGATSSQALSAADRLATAQQRLEAETLGAASAQDRLQRELRESQSAVTNAAGASETASRTYADGWKGVGQRVKQYLSSGVRNATDDAETQAEQGGRQSGSVFGNAFKAGIGLMAAKFSVDTVVGGIKDAIGGAGDIEQSIGAIGSVFKSAEGQMLAWSRAASKTVGLSSNDYNELATVLGAQLKNAGVSLDQVGSKANGLITTGADLSSMFGGTAAEAVGALSSALKGEMDPIEKYGISLNEASLKAQAMSMGLLKPVKDAGKIAVATGKMELAQRKYNDAVAKSGADSDKALAAKNTLTAAQNAFETATTGSLPAMDAQTKAVAVMAAIEKQSADAKGNFAKEEDTFSHKQQVAAAQWEDVSTKIGGIFLPAATAAFGFIGDKALPILDKVIGGLKAFGAAFSSADNDITSGGFAGHMERFGQIVRDSVAWVKDNSGAIATMAAILGTLLLPVLIRVGVQALISGAQQVASWAAAGAGAAKAAALYLINSYQIVGTWVAMGLAAVKSGAETAAIWLMYRMDSIKAVGSMIAARAAIVGSWVMMGVQSMLAGAKIAAAWVLAMGPIGWIIGGIALLVGAFVLAYNKLGWFKDGVNTVVRAVGGFFIWLWDNAVKPAFAGILIAAGAVASWFKGSFLPVVQGVISAVAAVFTWWVNTIVRPVFNTIFTIVNGFYLFFRGIIQLLVAVFVTILAPAFMNFWHKVVEPVFAAIGLLVQMWWTTVSGIFMAVVNFIRTVLGAVFTWFRDSVVTPVFGFIVAYIGFWWTTVSTIFTTAVTFIRTVLSAVFTWLRDSVIVPVFRFIAAVVTTWWTGVSFVFNLVIGFIRNSLASAFTWFRDSIITPVWNGIAGTIKSVWENNIKPVFDFLSNAIRNDVPNAFQKGVDGIKKIWETLLAVAKAPVLFVINKVINEGLIGSFNTVAGFLPGGIKKLDPVAPPKGWSGGGWTGPGARLQPAGVVHADEFVVKKSSRRSIEGRAPGLLDAFNQQGAGALGMLGFANGGRVWPTKSKTLTQGYSSFHDGIDIGVPVGTPVFATGPGVVDFAGVSPNLGNVWGGNEIRVMGDGMERWFSHLSQIMVKVGQKVSPGQQIGLSGNSGITSGPHLHFGVYQGGYPNAMNPLSYLAGASAPAGGDGGGGFNPIAALVGMARNKLTAAFPAGGAMANVAIGTGEKLIGGVSEWVKGKLAAVGNFVGGAVKSVGNFVGDSAMKARWTPTATDALWRTGHRDVGFTGNLASMLRRMMQESGGNPNAVNNWDSNAAMGQASRGLMQVIPSTFEAYRDRGLSADIFNPLANMVASINYTQDKYGDLRKGWDRPGGYSKGGLVTPTLYDGGGWLTNTGAPQIIDHQRRKPDAVLTNEQWRDVHTLVSEPTGPGTVQWNVQLPSGATVNEFMDAVSHKERVNARGGARR